MFRRGTVSLLIGVVALMSLAYPQNPIAEWLQQRWTTKETPLDAPERGEVVLFEGALETLPLRPRLALMGSGQSQFPVAEHIYRGLPAWLVITDGYGSGGQLIFSRPLRLPRPLSDYELVITLIPPVPLEIPTTSATGQPSAPGMPGAGAPGAPGVSGPETGGPPGGEAGYGPGGLPGGMPFGGPPFGGAPFGGAPFGGPASPSGGGAPGFLGGSFGGPGFSPFGYGGMGIIGGSRQRRLGVRRFINPSAGLSGGMLNPYGGALGGFLGGMPGGETGPGMPYRPGGLGRPGMGGTAPGMAGTQSPMRQPAVIHTLKHLSLLLVTDKGRFNVTFRLPPDDALTFDDLWATLVVPLQLAGKSPEPPLSLYRLGISGDAPDELYIARITLRPVTPNQPFLQLRSSALMLPAPAAPGEKPLPRYFVRVNQPLTMEAFVTGTVLPMEILWDFTDENGIQPDLPDRRGRQVSFTFDKPGVHECAVMARDVYGLMKPIVERFQVEVR